MENQVEGSAISTVIAGFDFKRFQSVLASTAAPKVSGRYRFLDTKEALGILHDYGWMPVAANQARVRKVENQGYQRHAVRLVNSSLNNGLVISDVQPQLLLVTSHCASNSLRLFLCMHVFLCGNGLVRWSGEIDSIRIPHTKDGAELLAGAIGRLAGDVPKTLERIEKYKAVRLTEEQARAFSMSAIEMRWDTDAYEVDPAALLNARRQQDDGLTDWQVFNRIQENIIKGGVKVLNKRTNKTTLSRRIQGIQSDVRLNAGLWSLAERYAVEG